MSEWKNNIREAHEVAVEQDRPLYVGEWGIYPVNDRKNYANWLDDLEELKDLEKDLKNKFQKEILPLLREEIEKIRKKLEEFRKKYKKQEDDKEIWTCIDRVGLHLAP